jgi:hypothetical protein
MAFTFIPESNSRSSRNTVRNYLRIAFTLSQIPHMRTAEDLSRYFRDEVVASALPQFERTGRGARPPASQEPFAPHSVVREILRERR